QLHEGHAARTRSDARLTRSRALVHRSSAEPARSQRCDAARCISASAAHAVPHGLASLLSLTSSSRRSPARAEPFAGGGAGAAGGGGGGGAGSRVAAPCAGAGFEGARPSTSSSLLSA